MRTALYRFLTHVDAIENGILLRDSVVAFGREPLGSPDAPSAELQQLVRSIRESGLQPVLNGSVLLLAAATEQFIKDLMIAYLRQLPKVVPLYRDLPRSIRAANEQRTGDALSNGHPDLGPSDIERFVRNLYDCLDGVTPYALNGEAIALNDRNLDARRLRHMIGRLGIDQIWGLVGITRPLKVWSGQNLASVEASRAQALHNEFIANRNQIAHRVGNVDPGPDVVRSYVQLWKALSRSLVESLGVFLEFYAVSVAYDFRHMRSRQ